MICPLHLGHIHDPFGALAIDIQTCWYSSASQPGLSETIMSSKHGL